MSTWRILVLVIGFPATLAATTAAWLAFSPSTLVQVRIVADGGVTGRAALAEAALRLGTAPDRSTLLGEYGDELVIAIRDGDAVLARQRAQSAADSLLNMPFRTEPVATPATPDSRPRGGRTALLADRARLLAAADAADARATAISSGLTSLARDLAAGARSATDRKGGRETLDKGAAILAELQLRRIQLQSRYQDDYPAVVVLDGQIRDLRIFLQDEAHRLDASARVPSTDLADPILSGERDRLRAELAQVNERRIGLATELAAIARLIDATPGDLAPARLQPPVARPAPILVEADTTVVPGPDWRWVSVPTAASIGLLLSLLAWFKPRLQRGTVPAELLLQRIEALVLGRTPLTALQDRYPALTRDDTAHLLAASNAWLRARG